MRLSPLLRHALLAAILIWSQVWSARHDAQHAGTAQELAGACAWCVYGGGPQALPGPTLQITLAPPAQVWVAPAPVAVAIAKTVGVYRSRAPPAETV